MRRLGLLLLLLHPFNSGICQQTSNRPKVGVALQGGGAKGLAHIGVLQWFEDHHIPIDYLAGTSMGGLIGGLYATGYSPAEIQHIVQNVDWDSVLAGQTQYPDLAFRRKEDLRSIPNGLELGLRHGPQLPGGLNSGQAVRMIIDRYVLPYSAVSSFDALPTPFRCVATDLVSGKPVIFQNGSLSDALRATMSIPGVFSPVEHDGRILADGGLLDNLPTDVAKQMGADIVIGVHLTTGPVVPKNLTSLLQVAGGSTDVMIDANELRGMQQADILITVNLEGYSTLDFSSVDKIIPEGTRAAAQRSALLDRLRLSDEEWQRYQADRRSRMIRTVPAPAFVEVAGAPPNLSKDIQKELLPFVGKPLDTPRLEAALATQIGIGRLNSLNFSLTDHDGSTGLLVTAEDKEYSPPWIKPGFTIDGSDPNNVQFTFGARTTFLDVGGYRSELRSDFSIGSIYSFDTEYYHPFTATTRWFIAPEINVSRSPLNLYVKNTLLAEYKKNQAGGGIDVGYAFDRYSELRLGYQAGYEAVNRWIGSPVLPSVAGRTGITRLQYALDRLDNPIIPRGGVAVLAYGGWTDANPGAARPFPSSEVTFEAFHPVSRPASVYLIAEGATTYGFDRTGLPAFALGGPSRLAGYGVNQFLTNQYWYGRVGYLRLLAHMPALLGSGVYLDAHYELAKPYALPGLAKPPGLPNDGVVGLIAQTILGPVLIGGSMGDAAHREWFFQLGRVF